MVKPSEVAPACSAAIARLLPLYCDPQAVRVVQGGVDTAQALLRLKWDKIFFTGESLRTATRLEDRVAGWLVGWGEIGHLS